MEVDYERNTTRSIATINLRYKLSGTRAIDYIAGRFCLVADNQQLVGLSLETGEEVTRNTLSHGLSEMVGSSSTGRFKSYVPSAERSMIPSTSLSASLTPALEKYQRLLMMPSGFLILSFPAMPTTLQTRCISLKSQPGLSRSTQTLGSELQDHLRPQTQRR